MQKVWWWVVTLYYLTRDIDQAIKRLQARQACAKDQCGLPSSDGKNHHGD
jgi:hypothetical protein